MNSDRTIESLRAADEARPWIGAWAPARIVWYDPDTGERLWLGLAGSDEFLRELERSGFDLRRGPGDGPGAARAG